MKKSQQQLVNDLRELGSRDYGSSAFTGRLGQAEAQKKLLEAVIKCVQGRSYLFREDPE